MMKAQTRFWFLLFGALLAASGRANAAPRDYLVGVYAWNEFGEGGIVAPTRGENEMKLEAIRDVFVSP